MDLRRKLLTIVGVTLTCTLIAFYAITHGIVLGAFVSLEERNTQQNMNRFMNLLSEDLSSLDSMVRAWGPRDDTYTFLKDREPPVHREELRARDLHERQAQLHGLPEHLRGDLLREGLQPHLQTGGAPPHESRGDDNGEPDPQVLLPDQQQPERVPHALRGAGDGRLRPHHHEELRRGEPRDPHCGAFP